ncbi:Transcriptional regulator of trehalose utilization, LacI family [Pseudoalteromonas luteoviolacea B = ATCC 29581]|nr:Transcriptional regulator of trehalose utilization, LacI family [Pseudoalteromonas luteoviolacea B = ATCC 29581]
MSGQKVTLAILAQLAGVSTSTASRALHNNPLIKKETRDKIQKLAKENNFSLNAAASRLRLQKTNVIAVIINLEKETEQSIDDPFLLKVVSDINLAVNQKGYELLLSNSYMAGEDWHGYFISGRRADGLIVVGQGKNQDNIDRAARFGTPLVVWGDPKTPATYPIVGSDNFLGGKTATEHLLAKGATRFLFLGDPQHAELGERYRGFQSAIDLTDKRFDAELVPIDITSDAAYKAINQKLRTDGLTFDAIFACSDMVALGAMKALKERYISIPNDVRIVGFDNIAMADVSHPSLTTIAQNTKAASRLLVKKLIQQLHGEVATSEQVEIQLVSRQSS